MSDARVDAEIGATDLDEKPTEGQVTAAAVPTETAPATDASKEEDAPGGE